MKRLGVMLIVIGVIIAAYPVMRRVYSWYWQERLFMEWENELRQESTESSEESGALKGDSSENILDSFKQLGATLESMNDETEEGQEETAAYEYDNSTGQNQESLFLSKNMIGIIEIEKIDARLPILEGTSPDVLKIGAGRLSGSAGIGEKGNTVISAHRSHTYGRMFNRLDEVEIDDIIKISTKDKEYYYKVYDINVVEPTDKSVLYGKSDEQILTLITCTPLYTASHRLIVRAKIEQ